MLLNPPVNCPPFVIADVSKPMLLPKRTKKMVEAVASVSPKTVVAVCVFLLVKSLIGNEITLIVE